MTQSDSNTTPVTDVVGEPEYPHTRKVGRYLFYAPCAIGFGTLIGGVLIAIGVARDLAVPVGNLCSFFAFLALRDIEKNAEKRALTKGTPDV